MTYLLDANVLSETRKRQPAAGVADWIAATPPERMHVSVVTLGEIEQGIARVRGRGDLYQAAALEHWLRDVESGFEDRVLSVTLPVAAAWAASSTHSLSRLSTRSSRQRRGYTA